mgnify:CR=1 FL=1
MECQLLLARCLEAAQAADADGKPTLAGLRLAQPGLRLADLGGRRPTLIQGNSCANADGGVGCANVGAPGISAESQLQPVGK